MKIADFGLSRDIHEKAYYTSTARGRRLPVKWMSIESLNTGRFSTKSDVVSIEMMNPRLQFPLSVHFMHVFMPALFCVVVVRRAIVGSAHARCDAISGCRQFRH